MENGMFDENIRMNHILYDAKVGLWSIEIEEGRNGCMQTGQCWSCWA